VPQARPDTFSPVPPDLAARLAARTLELVDVPSESRDEAALSAHVIAVLRDAGVAVRDAGDTCVLAGVTERGERPLALLAGHLDTVPAQDNIPGRIEDGVVHGLGAADMKGSLAVMMELAIDRAARGTEGDALDLGFVFFGREELPVALSALQPLLEREPGLRTADLAVVMEPTASALQAGCLGNVNATWTFRGRSGHSARPWLADNAIHRAAHGIAAIARLEPVAHAFGGLTYTEVVSVTMVTGGIAENVIPDHVTAQVNYRYPPGITAEQAAERLHALCDPHGELEITSNAPSGPVPLDNPLVDRLRESGDLPLEPKQAWTPVAEFGAAGVDAVNFGPGKPPHAHTRDERVAVADLVRAYEILDAFASA
jgi:succinyl-diaminopimelate desuccinylase